MDKQQQTELLALNTEFAMIASEARDAGIIGAQSSTGGGAERTTLLFDPAELYGRAAVKMASSISPDTADVTAGDIARSIRMTAAKIRAGDRSYIIESMLGMSVWLQAMAVSLADYGAGISDSRKKAALGHLLLKMEATSAKILASLAAVACLERSR